MCKCLHIFYSDPPTLATSKFYKQDGFHSKLVCLTDRALPSAQLGHVPCQLLQAAE